MERVPRIREEADFASLVKFQKTGIWRKWRVKTRETANGQKVSIGWAVITVAVL